MVLITLDVKTNTLPISNVCVCVCLAGFAHNCVHSVLYVVGCVYFLLSRDLQCVRLSVRVCAVCVCVCVCACEGASVCLCVGRQSIWLKTL